MSPTLSTSGLLDIVVPTPLGRRPARLGFRRLGDPQQAEKILLVHGAGQAQEAWPGQYGLSQVADTVAVDLLGFGASETPPHAESVVPAQVAVILAVLDRLRWRQATLVGYSMGGAITLLTALQAPRRVGRIVLIAGAALVQPVPISFKFLSMPGAAQALWAASNLARWTGLDGELGTFWSFDDETGRRMVAAQCRLGHDRAFASAARQLKPRHYGHTARFYERLTQPALLLYGTADHLVPIDVGRRLVHLLPNAELVEFPGEGHLLHERPGNRIAERITEFIGRTRPGLR